jgi:type I restriction enzyme S subunit
MFLDRETGRVDRLVAKKRELVERLQENRTALISRTVTRGLPPDAARIAGLRENPSLKSSGVDWVGEIPKHWEVKRLGYLAMLKSGENITSEMISEGGSYPVYGGNGLRGNYHEFTHRGHYVLIGRQGALCGNINYGSGEFWASEHALVVWPLKKFAVVWLGELLRAMNLGQYSVTAAQPGIAAEVIRGVRIPVPPLPEQSAIAAFLEAETAKLDALIGKVNEAIERLQEYRTALITAAVTGKIDVRKAAA